MNTNTLIQKISCLLPALLLTISSEGKQASMSQGKHKIIVQRAANIKENLAEVKQATEAATQKVESLSEQEDQEFLRSENPDLSQKERLNHLAVSLNHRADVYLEVKNLAVSNGDRLARVENDLADIDRALAKSPYLANDPKTLDAVNQVRTNLARSIEVDAKLSMLAGKASMNGQLSQETARIYRLSQGQLASAIKATSSKDGKSRGEAFRKQVEELRYSVRSRRTRMAMIAKVTDRSLREIEVFAATQGTRVIFDEIDRSLDGIAPDDDPLGLKLLRPEANDRYWNWSQNEDQYRTDSPRVIQARAFTPINERINPNEL